MVQVACFALLSSPFMISHHQQQHHIIGLTKPGGNGKPRKSSARLGMTTRTKTCQVMRSIIPTATVQRCPR